MDFCRQCANEENRERATKRIESIESIAHSKKRMDVFPRPPTADETTRRRRSWEIGARSATSVVSSRSTRRADDRSIDPSIDRSIVGLGSRSPVLHHPSRRSVPTNSRARTMFSVEPRDQSARTTTLRFACVVERNKFSVSHSDRTSIHPSRSSSSYLSSRIHPSSIIIRPRSGIESNERSVFAHAPHGRRATC